MKTSKFTEEQIAYGLRQVERTTRQCATLTHYMSLIMITGH
jgi:hypothetical protein